MSQYHKFEIHSGPAPFDAKILMDGQPLRGVTRLEVILEAGDVAKIKIEMLPGELEIMAEGDPEFCQKLINLGALADYHKRFIRHQEPGQ